MGQGAQIGRVAISAWRAGIDFALPPRCPGCGMVVDGDHRFCAGCWTGLEFLGDPACACCGARIAAAGVRCDACRVRPPAFDRARAAVGYGDVARAVALRLKYARRPGVARTMAAAMARLLDDAPANALLAAVPLHRWRLWSRGYNQALLIADALARATGRPLARDLIERRRATPVLRGLGRQARARAVDGAFRVHDARRPLIAGRTVILIDDVFTTGATVSACATALRAAGAAAVWVACWARVVHPEPSPDRPEH